MKTTLVMLLVTAGSLAAFAAPPPGGRGPGPGPGPGGRWAGMNEEDREEFRAERMEARAREVRLMYVVAISEALGLNEAEALKLSEKLKVVEEKRRPLRQGMGEAMKVLRDAAEGHQAALAQVDVSVQKVLDGRAQMAALDKELFTTLAQGSAPQQRARLALVLARLHGERGPRKGR